MSLFDDVAGVAVTSAPLELNDLLRTSARLMIRFGNATVWSLFVRQGSRCSPISAGRSDLLSGFVIVIGSSQLS